jgi:hypothetical protein
MIVRLMSDESVESVETGDWPDVEHIHFQISGEIGSSLAQPDERKAP